MFSFLLLLNLHKTTYFCFLCDIRVQMFGRNTFLQRNFDTQITKESAKKFDLFQLRIQEQLQKWFQTLITFWQRRILPHLCFYFLFFPSLPLFSFFLSFFLSFFIYFFLSFLLTYLLTYLLTNLLTYLLSFFIKCKC